MLKKLKKHINFFILTYLISLCFSCDINKISYGYLLDKQEYSLFIQKVFTNIKVKPTDFAYPIYIKMQNFEPTLNNVFLSACFLGDVNLIDKISNMGGSLSFKDDEKYYPISYAIFSKNLQAVKYIISMSDTKELLIKDDFNSNLIQLAAAVGNVDIFNEFMNMDLFKMDYKNYSGDTALHIASYYGNEEIVKELLFETSSILYQKNNYGYTPFLYSFFSNNIDLIDYLYVMSGINSINSTNEFSDNVLNVACLSGNIDVVKYVLNSLNVNDVNYQNQFGQTAPMIAAAMGNDDIFSLLIINNPDLTIKDNEQNDVKYYAMLKNNSNIKSMIGMK